MGVTERMAQFVVDTTYEDIPPEAIRIAKEISLDCVGTALAGYVDPVGRIITKVVRDLGGAPECTVIGAGFQTSSAQAALANGAMAHALDYDDMGLSMGHPSVVVLPAILALGEKMHVSGNEALTAHIVGFEVQGKLGYGSQELYSQGWHATGIFGTMGATAAAAKLLHLNVEQTKMAFGIAASHAAAAKPNIGTMTKPLHAGNAARAGIMAALLAREGYTAEPDIIEHPLGFAHAFVHDGRYDLEKMVGTIGNPWHILSPGVILKKYPCCGGNHLALDAIFKLMEQHAISYEDVEQVRVDVTPMTDLVLAFKEPRTGYEGKFSLEYNMAAALVDGRVTRDTFTDEKLADPRVQETMKKVQMVVHDDWGTELGRHGNPVTVTTKGGQQLTDPGDVIRGSPAQPLTVEEIVEKYRDNARLVISDDDIQRSIDMMLDLENLKDVADILNTVKGG